MGTAEVIAEQKKATYTSYVRCYLELGTSNHTFTTTGSVISGVTDTTNRVLPGFRRWEPYREVVDFVLSNKGQALSALDLRGYKLTLGIGFVIDGTPDYINRPPVWVISQEFDSRPGKLTLTLHCKGTMSRIADDRASAEFTASDTDTISALLISNLESTAGYFSHCTAYTLDWTGVTLGTDVNLFLPAANFQTFLNSNRLERANYLLDHTYVYMRPAADGSIDFIKPTQGAFDYEYELTGDHTFFIKIDSRKVVTPSQVIVYGGTYDENTDTWEFQSADPAGAATDCWFESFEGITSVAECQAAAAAILSGFTLNKKSSSALVPMNCTAKLFDYVKITDSRQGDSATGNIGYIVERWGADLKPNGFQMEIGFGWMASRKVAEFVANTRRPVKETQTVWFTTSCPETYLLAADSIIIHTVPQQTGGRDRLYVKAYNVYAGGVSGVNLKISQNGSVKWSKTGDDTYQYWTEKFVGLTDDGAFTFTIENENATLSCYVTAFCTYGLNTTGPS